MGADRLDVRRKKKIWFINNALVCMSLLDLLLEIKMTVQISSFSIRHWFQTHFRFFLVQKELKRHVNF